MIKDDWGNEIKEGDVVHFSYGIPPVGVDATVFAEGKKLFVRVPPPHKPEVTTLKFLKDNFNIYKESA